MICVILQMVHPMSYSELFIVLISKWLAFWEFLYFHDDVNKWKHFPRYWPFVWGIHRSPVTSPHKGQRRGALIFSLIWARINSLVNNGEAGDLRRHRSHCDVTVMTTVYIHVIFYRVCFQISSNFISSVQASNSRKKGFCADFIYRCLWKLIWF